MNVTGIWRTVVVAWLVILPVLGRTQVVIGVVEDGPHARSLIPLDVLSTELGQLTAGEFDIRFPADKRLDGGWTRAGAQRALQRLLADPEVDVVLCAGFIVSHEAARIPALAKPVIASIVSDQRLQGFPQRGLSSGKKNFVYVTNFHAIDDDLRLFRQAVPFGHLAILVDAETLQAVLDLSASKFSQLSEQLGVRITPVPVGNSVPAVLRALPGDVDAVYVTPLLRFDGQAMRELAQGFIQRKLPSFSLYGVSEIEAGLLMASGGRPGDLIRVARRIALNIQRILLGEDAGDLPVALQGSHRLAINMRTARSIGYSPRFAVLTDAEQYFRDEAEAGTPLTLVAAMNEAVQANLDLQVSSYGPRLAGEEVRSARAALLPQLELGGQWARVDARRAFPGIRAERSTDVTGEVRQLIYSDDARAAWQISRHLESVSGERHRAVVLDTLRAAGRHYMNLLRAMALEDVRRSNLEVTRANLSLATVRESIGYSGRADVLRWQSRLALDRRDLIDARASRYQAETQLNRVLNRPLDDHIKPLDSSVEAALTLFGRKRFQALIDNERAWSTFQDFVVSKGLEQSPEARQAGRLVEAGERRVLAARRRFWLPELALEAAGSSNLDRSGAGAGSIDLGGGPIGLQDRSWNIGLRARLPVFSGGALRAGLNHARLALRQQRRQREAVEERVAMQIRLALQRVGSSYPAIELSTAAAQASSENLRIVTDAYSKGAVSVTDLIDAQNAALTARLAAAEARYVYLADLIDVLRAAGDFSLMLDAQRQEGWFREVEEFFAMRGVPLDE